MIYVLINNQPYKNYIINLKTDNINLINFINKKHRYKDTYNPCFILKIDNVINNNWLINNINNKIKSKPIQQNNKRILVVLPTYNRTIFLFKRIQEILNQTYPHFLLLIINDGSDDKNTNSFNDLKSINTSNKVIFLHNNKNLGIANTLNRGLNYMFHLNQHLHLN